MTIALHYVYNTPKDLLIWDVGHQAYGHKLLTGRKADFHTNRQLDGISGFPKRTESNFDTFGVGLGDARAVLTPSFGLTFHLLRLNWVPWRNSLL